MSSPSEDPPFSECDQAGDALPLRQGDVVEDLSPLDREVRFGVIVTADCDIAQLKHNNTLSYVPLFSLQRYLATFYIPKRLDKALTQLRQEIIRRATAFRQATHPESTPFSEQAIDVWVDSADGNAIAETLGAAANRKRDEFVAIVDAYRSARGARETTELEAGVAALSAVKIHQGMAPAKATANVMEDIHGYLKTLPGDAFFVTSIGLAPELRGGYVAYLRVLRELHPSQVALRPADLRSADIRVKRVARMRSPFVYRLTQQLAAVFSSIGLPTAYEQERDRIVTILKNPVTP